MKFAKARVGEKFVFPEKGGLWEKTGDDTASMVFPHPERPCCHIDTELNVYVIFERDKGAPQPQPKLKPTEKTKPKQDPLVKQGGGMKLVIQDEDTGEALLEIHDVSPQEVTAYTQTDEIQATPKGKRKIRGYYPVGTVTSHGENAMYVMVRCGTEV